MILTTTVNETAATRIAGQKAEMAPLGFVENDRERFAIGTRLIQAGQDRWTQEQRAHAERPIVSYACDRLIDRVQSEMREDIPARMGESVYSPAGRLYLDGDANYGFEARGFRAFAGAIAPNSGAYLEACPPQLRADNVRHWLGQAGDDERVIRTRRDAVSGDRNVWAVVGDSYAFCDANEVARIAAEVLDPTMRATVVYDGYRTRIDAFAHSPVSAEEAGVGELMRIGVSIQTADDGTKAIGVQALCERVRCVNLTRIKGKTQRVRVPHMGRDVIGRARDAVSGAMDLARGIVTRWAEADKDEILSGEADPRKKFEALVNGGHVKATGVKREEMVNRLIRAWEREPARYTRTALVNAITRAAHENPWSSPWAQQEVEEQAGQLLYARVVLN